MNKKRSKNSPKVTYVTSHYACDQRGRLGSTSEQDVNISYSRASDSTRKYVIQGTKRKRAGYMLQWEPGIPIAIVGAKDNTHSVSHGMQQALGYAEILGFKCI